MSADKPPARPNRNGGATSIVTAVSVSLLPFELTGDRPRLVQLRRGSSSQSASAFSVSSINDAWAYAPPARISAATQIASISSCGVAPARRAALV